jgi:23S rRNA (pseudouridine1915-N3)-methyltransferase
VAERFAVLVVGRGACPWADEAVRDWTQRIRRAGGVDQIEVPAEPFRGDVEAVRLRESQRVLAKVGPRDKLVVLDERGDGVDSAGFAALVDQGMQRGRVLFALGGPYGHHEATRAAAWRVVRLSELVLNHEVARVVLYEQLYRALSILAGSPYHH